MWLKVDLILLATPSIVHSLLLLLLLCPSSISEAALRLCDVIKVIDGQRATEHNPDDPRAVCYLI